MIFETELISGYEIDLRFYVFDTLVHAQELLHLFTKEDDFEKWREGSC